MESIVLSDLATLVITSITSLFLLYCSWHKATGLLPIVGSGIGGILAITSILNLFIHGTSPSAWWIACISLAILLISIAVGLYLQPPTAPASQHPAYQTFRPTIFSIKITLVISLATAALVIYCGFYKTTGIFISGLGGFAGGAMMISCINLFFMGKEPRSKIFALVSFLIFAASIGLSFWFRYKA